MSTIIDTVQQHLPFHRAGKQCNLCPPMPSGSSLRANLQIYSALLCHHSTAKHCKQHAFCFAPALASSCGMGCWSAVS